MLKKNSRGTVKLTFLGHQNAPLYYLNPKFFFPFQGGLFPLHPPLPLRGLQKTSFFGEKIWSEKGGGQKYKSQLIYKTSGFQLKIILVTKTFFWRSKLIIFFRLFTRLGSSSLYPLSLCWRFETLYFFLVFGIFLLRTLNYLF